MIYALLRLLPVAADVTASPVLGLDVPVWRPELSYVLYEVNWVARYTPTTTTANKMNIAVQEIDFTSIKCFSIVLYLTEAKVSGVNN